ncbi:TRAP transporter small permease subunit [Pseudahrensia aquimaris]|uniref:TRAP transporter small permease protein n=1 Tax=Pseudahrensia aquimaris TaxID=744461 RepID=A0ABW3FA45_9HYPH
MIENLNRIASRIAMVALMLVVGFQFTAVLARHSFGASLSWLEEGAVFAHGAVFMLAAGWTLAKGRHVAIDVLSDRFGPSGKERAAQIGTVLFLVPLTVGILALSLPYVSASWRTLEGSAAVSGLPGVFLLKSLLVIFALLLLLGGWSATRRSTKG